MEFQIIWNDVASVMELPFHLNANHGHLQQQTAVTDKLYNQTNQWQSDASPRSSDRDLIDNSNEDLYRWQPEDEEDNNEDLKNAPLQPTDGSYSDIVADNENGNAMTMATLHRKRKYNWDQHLHGDEEESERKSVEESEARKLQHRETGVKKQNTGSPSGRMSSWDLAENLAADLDGSLSGLGVDLSTASYNMSEALLALPSLNGFKQEAPSPNSLNDNALASNSNVGVREADSNTPSFKNALQANSQHGSASSLHQLLQQQSSYNVTSTVLPSQQQLDNNNGETQYQPTKPALPSSTSNLQDLGIDCRFQYVLAAATSIATKVNEETLTYLNQGQSYEIKLKKLGELSAYRGKILKSVIRICFHERRLQFLEHEQITAWRASRPGERIVEVDIPLSYGVYDVIQDHWLLNTVEFLWDPTKEVGVYIKVNCISTEFTPKKHGGEKGVPFRIQVETYLQGEGSSIRLHAGACQIKVFKLKGGDRKHKQDREKILKRPASEHDKFQPSYDCTVLNDIPSELLYGAQIPSELIYGAQMNSAVSSSVPVYSPTETSVNPNRGNVTPTSSTNLATNAIAKEEHTQAPIVPQLVSLPSPDAAVNNIPADQQSLPSQDIPLDCSTILSVAATAQQTSQWLQAQRFGAYLRMFTSFTGADIYRLSRDDFIQICGIPDGIRLHNMLNLWSVPPRLALYIRVEPASVYRGLYLGALTSIEFATKLAEMLGMAANQIHGVFMQGPAGIHVLVTDDLVRTIKNKAAYAIEMLRDQSRERYRLLLKPISDE